MKNGAIWFTAPSKSFTLHLGICHKFRSLFHCYKFFFFFCININFVFQDLFCIFYFLQRQLSVSRKTEAGKLFSKEEKISVLFLNAICMYTMFSDMSIRSGEQSVFSIGEGVCLSQLWWPLDMAFMWFKRKTFNLSIRVFDIYKNMTT